MTDPTRLRQVMLNLVGNAIKFTERGSVTLHLGCQAESEQLTIRVVDTGIGMTSEQRDTIAQFGAFTQADTSTTRLYGGTGLGLRISNAIVTMLGGAIDVQSQRGEGSTFTVTIRTGPLAGVPFVEPEQLAAQSRPGELSTVDDESAPPAQPLEGIRVLLAEDGPDNQRLITFHLEKAGATVELAADGQAAVDAIANQAGAALPHVILMDMQMPILDGYGATRALRQRGCMLPIIALTAHAMDGHRQRCLDAGCDDFLSKPIDKVQLVDVCAQYASGAARGSRAA